MSANCSPFAAVRLMTGLSWRQSIERKKKGGEGRRKGSRRRRGGVNVERRHRVLFIPTSTRLSPPAVPLQFAEKKKEGRRRKGEGGGGRCAPPQAVSFCRSPGRLKILFHPPLRGRHEKKGEEEGGGGVEMLAHDQFRISMVSLKRVCHQGSGRGKEERGEKGKRRGRTNVVRNGGGAERWLRLSPDRPTPAITAFVDRKKEKKRGKKGRKRREVPDVVCRVKLCAGEPLT